MPPRRKASTAGSFSPNGAASSPATSIGDPMNDKNSVDAAPADLLHPQAGPSAGGQQRSASTEEEEEDTYVTSDDDDEDDLEAPSADGIRRRKVKVDARGRPRPAYYYPSGTLAKGVPVFEPSMEDFEDFYKFVKSVDHYGMRSGIVKVVPPREWSQSLPDVSEQLKVVRLRQPIEQHFIGQGGLFRCTNVAKSKTWNAKSWKEHTEKKEFATPDFFESDERASAPRSARGRDRRAKAVEEEPDLVEPEVPGSTPVTAAVLAPPSTPARIIDAPDVDTPTPPRDNAYKPSKGKRGAMASEIDDEVWDQWHGKWNELPNGAKPEHFTVEACQDIERRYWRTLLFGNPPMYGADMSGSLFTSKTRKWNVAHLDNLLTRMRTKPVAGVNTPYLYFGMWRATFSWHVEDANLYSINYIHHGAPKFWYSVPQEHAERFERAMSGWFPQDRAKCSEFLRHKSFLASPKLLAQQSIPLNRCVQLPGEFIMTYPMGYHSGFNLGYNCAESLNFATETWLDIGRKAKACQCVDDSVSINVDAWLAEAEAVTGIKRKYDDEEFFDPVPQESGVSRYGRVKKPKIEFDEMPEVNSARMEAQRKKYAEKAAKAAEKAAGEAASKFKCVFCPDNSTEGLIPLAPVPDGGVLSDDLAARRTAGHAHKTCLAFLPTTWVEVDDETGEEFGGGFEDVEKARWALNCFVCTDKAAARHGAKVQCTKSAKCVRACHVTCGFREDSGVYMDLLEVRDGAEVSLLAPIDSIPVDPPAPSEYVGEEHSTRIVVLCRQHNPDFVKSQRARAANEMQAKVDALQPGSRLKIRASGGIYATTLIAKLPERDSVHVRYDDGLEKTFKVSAIVWPVVKGTPYASSSKNEYAKHYTSSARQIDDVEEYEQTAPAPVYPAASYGGAQSDFDAFARLVAAQESIS